MLNVKKALTKLLNKVQFVRDSWEDISSAFTRSSNVTFLKAATNGELVAIQLTSKGATDQQTIVRINDTNYKLANGYSYFPLSCFFMNYADMDRQTNAAILGDSIQLRCTSASTGGGGVQIGGVYPINKIGGGNT